ncbi:MAG: DUF5667 domain-containing protein [Ktedonobacterales bacterium]
MNDEDRLLDDVSHWRRATPVLMMEPDPPLVAASAELARALRLVERLGDVPLPPCEIEQARARVRARLNAVLFGALDGASPPATLPTAHDREPARPHTRDDSLPAGVCVYTRARASVRRTPPLAAAALALLLCAFGLAGVSYAAGSALPGSPLYGLKRGEEWVALRSAWSDVRRGEVLGAIAQQRLAEARAAAASGDRAEVRTLTAELNSAVNDLIALDAQMSLRHESTSIVAMALATTLADEDSALAAAQQRGERALVKSLATMARNQLRVIQAQHIALPLLPSSLSVPAVTAAATMAAIPVVGAIRHTHGTLPAYVPPLATPTANGSAHALAGAEAGAAASSHGQHTPANGAGRASGKAGGHANRTGRPAGGH